VLHRLQEHAAPERREELLQVAEALLVAVARRGDLKNATPRRCTTEEQALLKNGVILSSLKELRSPESIRFLTWLSLR